LEAVLSEVKCWYERQNVIMSTSFCSGYDEIDELYV